MVLWWLGNGLGAVNSPAPPVGAHGAAIWRADRRLTLRLMVTAEPQLCTESRPGNSGSG